MSRATRDSRAETLSPIFIPFLQGAFIPFHMPVYPGALPGTNWGPVKDHYAHKVTINGKLDMPQEETHLTTAIGGVRLSSKVAYPASKMLRFSSRPNSPQ